MSLLHCFQCLVLFISLFVVCCYGDVVQGGCKNSERLEAISAKLDITNQKLDAQDDVLRQLNEKIDLLIGGERTTPVVTTAPEGFSSCADVYRAGHQNSGVYMLQLDSNTIPTATVYCDMSDGGGWNVFQRRINGSINFFRTWDEYKNGFGDPDLEHWLGNDILAIMTSDRSVQYELLVSAVTFNGETGVYKYTNFRLGPESDKYQLLLDDNNGYPDDEGVGLSRNNGKYFTTRDQDNDEFSANCAADEYEGGWWYSSSCGFTNLNAPYIDHRVSSNGPGIFWNPLDGFYTLQYTQMSFRPMAQN